MNMSRNLKCITFIWYLTPMVCAQTCDFLSQNQRYEGHLWLTALFDINFSFKDMRSFIPAY